PHGFVTAPPVSVPHGCELLTEGAPVPGLLLDLTEGRVLVAFRGFGLALGQAPVAVARPVDDQHLEAVTRRCPGHHAARGADGSGFGVTARHIHARSRRARAASHALASPARARTASPRSIS